MKKPFVLISISGLLLVLFTACDTPEKLYAKGIERYNAENYDEAIAAFSKAVEKEPSYSDAYNMRGACYAQKSEFFTAIKDYDKALEINPDNFAAYANRGMAYYQSKEYQNAADDLVKYTNKVNDNAVYFYYLGLAYCGVEQAEPALASFTKAIEITPTADYYNTRGTVYDAIGQYSSAINDFNAALKLDGENEFARNNLASSQQKLKEKQAKEQADNFWNSFSPYFDRALRRAEDEQYERLMGRR